MNAVYLLPVNLYGPGDNFDLDTQPRHPGHDPQVRRGPRPRRAAGRRCGATAARPASSSTSSDAARAFRLALERYDGPEPVNLGSGEEIAIGELAALVARATGYRGEVVWDTSKPNGQPRRRLATDRARALLGFEAAVPLREGIAELVAWYDQLP